jgi:hypothetical protein
VDPFSLSPVPNAIYWNWATIFILAFGNLGALDFQVRCMAAKNATRLDMDASLGGASRFSFAFRLHTWVPLREHTMDQTRSMHRLLQTPAPKVCSCLHVVNGSPTRLASLISFQIRHQHGSEPGALLGSLQLP